MNRPQMIRTVFYAFLIAVMTGCDTQYAPVIPDFNAPHIVANHSVTDSLVIMVSFPGGSTSSLWIAKGIGPGEEEPPLANYSGQFAFVAQTTPVRILLGPSNYNGVYQIVWDGKDSDGQPVKSGYYRIYLEWNHNVQHLDLYFISSSSPLLP